MKDNPTQRRAERSADVEKEAARYRLRRFYEILLKADKARMQSIQKKENNRDVNGVMSQ